ncbi:Lipase domain protein [Gracilaria domingensis]|nr:Lipase domain protein [Gracilaria domingensis]
MRGDGYASAGGGLHGPHHCDVQGNDVEAQRSNFASYEPPSSARGCAQQLERRRREQQTEAAVRVTLHAWESSPWVCCGVLEHCGRACAARADSSPAKGAACVPDGTQSGWGAGDALQPGPVGEAEPEPAGDFRFDVRLAACGKCELSGGVRPGGAAALAHCCGPGHDREDAVQRVQARGEEGGADGAGRHADRSQCAGWTTVDWGGVGLCVPSEGGVHAGDARVVHAAPRHDVHAGVLAVPGAAGGRAAVRGGVRAERVVGPGGDCEPRGQHQRDDRSAGKDGGRAREHGGGGEVGEPDAVQNAQGDAAAVIMGRSGGGARRTRYKKLFLPLLFISIFLCVKSQFGRVTHHSCVGRARRAGAPGEDLPRMPLAPARAAPRRAAPRRAARALGAPRASRFLGLAPPPRRCSRPASPSAANATSTVAPPRAYSSRRSPAPLRRARPLPPPRTPPSLCERAVRPLPPPCCAGRAVHRLRHLGPTPPPPPYTPSPPSFPPRPPPGPPPRAAPLPRRCVAAVVRLLLRRAVCSPYGEPAPRSACFSLRMAQEGGRRRLPLGSFLAPQWHRLVQQPQRVRPAVVAHQSAR